MLVLQQVKRSSLLFLVDLGTSLIKTFGYIKGSVKLEKIKLP